MATKGAGAMNEYDISYQQLGYDYDKSIHLPLRTLLFGKAMYVVQILMVVGAIICAGGASIAQRNGIKYTPVPFGRMESELIYVAWGCAGASLMASFVGCFGIHYEQIHIIDHKLLSIL